MATNSDDFDFESESLPGQVIGEAQPFFYCIFPEASKKYCATCFKSPAEIWPDLEEPPSLNSCTGCLQYKYCSKRCQVTDWEKFHKHECKIYAEHADKLQDTLVRDILRLVSIIQHRPEDLARKFQLIDGSEKSFSDLRSCFEEFKLGERNIEPFVASTNLLSSIGVQFDVRDLVAPFARLLMNLFLITGTSDENLGTGVYMLASIFDHSCEPNAYYAFDGSKMQIRALTRIPKDEPITISLIDSSMSRTERQEELRQLYGITCKCPKCDGEERGEFLANSEVKSGAEQLLELLSASDDLADLSLQQWYTFYLGVRKSDLKMGGDKRYTSNVLYFAEFADAPDGLVAFAKLISETFHKSWPDHPVCKRIDRSLDKILMDRSSKNINAIHGSSINELSSDQVMATNNDYVRFLPGQVIAEAQPIFYCISAEASVKYCATCFKSPAEIWPYQKEPPPLNSCGGCRKFKYCSKECQVTDWKMYHKYECKIYANHADQLQDLMVRNILRLAVMNEHRPEDLTRRFKLIDGGEKSFMDLRNCQEDFLPDGEREIEPFVAFTHLLSSFGLQFDAENLVAPFARAVMNQFAISGTIDEYLGTGMYIQASSLDHSCEPNAGYSFNGSKMLIRALGTILPDEPITISLIEDLSMSRTERQEALKVRHNITCKCSKCKSEEESQILFTSVQMKATLKQFGKLISASPNSVDISLEQWYTLYLELMQVYAKMVGRTTDTLKILSMAEFADDPNGLVSFATETSKTLRLSAGSTHRQQRAIKKIDRSLDKIHMNRSKNTNSHQ